MFVSFLYKNVNPKNRKTADCVLRAITEVSGRDYWEVLNDLLAISKKTGYCLLEKQCYERLLEAYGFVKHKQPRKLDNSKYYVGEIGSLTKSRAVVSMANHLTAYDGVRIVDLWDCRHKSIGNYYTLD